VEDAAKTSRRRRIAIDAVGHDVTWPNSAETTIVRVKKILIVVGAMTLIASAVLITVRAHSKARTFELTASSPQFWNLFEHDAKLTTVGNGFGFTEGPVWDPAGFLYVSDEETNKIFRLYTADGHKEELVSLGDPDGNTYDRHHHLIDCASVLRAIIQLDDKGHYTVLADRYEGKKFNSPNDVIIGPDGVIYFTDPTLDLPKGEKQEIPFQGVYRIGPEGHAQLLTKELSQPNGLAFSPNGKKFYVDDSEQRNIRVYDFEPNGSLKNGRIFGEEPGGKGERVPDGIKVDRQGNLYVTGPGGIWVWDSEGHHLGTISLPEQPANLAWGDADYSELYIAATTSVYRVKTKTHGYVPYLINPQ
jgi:gluconolactonase